MPIVRVGFEIPSDPERLYRLIWAYMPKWPDCTILDGTCPVCERKALRLWDVHH